ncbi:hypothetical protein [uncultured Ramlibacter sp.]|uniref:hypothetical protein n=1 Tax=uncultured Ramlibacter sp. TaxID=260755 RepID=UPI00260D824C|nr:hypothetical protein [uncultured Ramlibacter sp.]
MISETDWLRILAELGVRPFTAAKWAAPFANAVQPAKFSAGMADIVDWLPQILHECAMLEKLQENLNYSAERICQVWPGRFQRESDAAPYARNPEALANKVYGGRMGNTEPGDGWLYRGRCPIMATGKDAYILLGDQMGQDLVGMPHLIEGPIYGLEAAIAWWEGRVPDSMLGSQVKLRRRVNGGLIGMDHCANLALLCRKVMA